MRRNQYDHRTPMRATPMPLVNHDEGEYLIPDGFDQVVQESLSFQQGHSPGQPPPADIDSAWNHLTKGRTIGKRVVVQKVAGVSIVTQAPIDVLQVQGDDRDAIQLGITTLPPRVLPTAGLTLPDNIQDVQNDSTQFGPAGFNSGIAAAFGWTRLQMLVEWGIGGVQSQAIFDIMNGAMINIQASFVRLRCLIDNGGVLPAAIYGLSAFVGPAHAAPSRAQFTDQVVTLDPGITSAARPIPWLAKEVQVILAGVENLYQIVFFADAAGAIEVGRYVISTAAAGNVPPGRFLPVPGGGAMFYSITNNAAGARNYRAIFSLAV